MIQKTLQRIKEATFAIELPGPPSQKELPTPIGTGFFISSDGYFVTASHVIRDENEKLRLDINKTCLSKETIPGQGPVGCDNVSYVYDDVRLDFALLKVDFSTNKDKVWIKGKRTSFPYIPVSARELEEGEAVYAFGYPLSESMLVAPDKSLSFGFSSLSPRVTSAIVSSKIESTKMLMTLSDPKVYVLDKALNYGNSGGPIVAVETGNVHAFCSRFQPLFVPQNHLRYNGCPLEIMIPSLYGIVFSLGNEAILDKLSSLDVPLTTS